MNQYKSLLYSKTDNVVVHLGRLPEWISEQKTVKVLIKSQECVITSLPSSITWKEYRLMNSFGGKNMLPSQNQDLVNGQRLTHSTGGNVTVNFMAKLPDDLNYCCKIIGACINPFLGFDLCHRAIDLLNNEAFQCLRKVQENMDFVLSMAITEAQCSDVERKECSLPMDAPWLAASNPGGSMSIKEEGNGDDNLESSTDSQDCLQSANEGTSQLPCAFQTTEIYIPVSDCQETRPDALFHVKKENEDPLSEGNHPVMYTPNPLEISRDVTDPLATDELFHIKDEGEDHLSEENNPMLYMTDPAGSDASDPLATDDLSGIKTGSPFLKADLSSDDEGQDVHNDITDGTTNELPPQAPDQTHMQAQASTSSQGEEVDAEGTGAIVIDLDSMPVLANKESPKETDATESGIKTGSPFLKADLSSDDEGQDVHNDITDGTTNELPPQASDQAHAATSSQGEEVDAEERGAIGIDLGSMLVLANKELPPKETDATELSSTENGELIQKQTMTMESMTEAVDIPASERASALLALLEPKIRASNSRKVRKVMDKDIEKCGTLLADKITLCSIPDDGQFQSKSRRVSERGDRATMTVLGETSGCDNPDTIKVFMVTDSGKSGPEAVVRDNKEISTSVIKNPGKRAKPKDKSYHCINCGDVFNAKHDLTEHLKIHFGSGSLDIDANLQIGKHLALKTLFSRGESNSSYQPTSSESLNKPLYRRQGVRQKGNGLLKENFGETREKKNVRKVRKSFFVDGKSCADSPHTKTPYSCGEYEKCFLGKSDLVRHIRTHTKEKPYSCGECEKSFTQKGSLVRHMRSHTKEKPYTCGECEKSFSQKSDLVHHIRTHTKEKPYSCGECEKSFSRKSHLIYHIRTHTNEKPYPCKECEKSFSVRSNLVCHMRIHTKEKPYSCSECEKSFSHKNTLFRHIRTHTKEKPYSCNECEKSFSVRSSLVCHMRIHKKETPYTCV